jgi:hypothetical protein
MTDTCKKHCEATAFKIVIRGLEGEVARLKARLAQETALQTLHNENERLGLYKDAYAEPEQEPVAWGVFEGNLHDMFFTQEEAQEMARLKGSHAEVKPLYTHPPQPEQKPMHPDIKKLYEDYFDKCFRESSPPQRTWVGLTDEDFENAFQETYIMGDSDLQDFAKVIEAKLKEKNT